MIRFELARRVPDVWNDHWVADGSIGVNPLRLVGLSAAARQFAVGHPEFDLKSLIQSVENNPPSSFGAEIVAVRYLPAKKQFEVKSATNSAEISFNVDPEVLFFLQPGRAVTARAREFERLIDECIMLLNPTFGEASRIVGGADADLIVGDMLVPQVAIDRPSQAEFSKLDFCRRLPASVRRAEFSPVARRHGFAGVGPVEGMRQSLIEVR